MFVVFTDEAGDDVEQLDAAIEICRKFAMPVYVVGVPAPFGREDAYIKYVDPDPEFRPIGPVAAGASGAGVAVAGAHQAEFRRPARIRGTNRLRLRPLRLVPADLGDRRAVLHGASESQGGRQGRILGDRGLFVAPFGVLRRADDAQLPAGLRHRAAVLRPAGQEPRRAALVQAAQVSWTTPMENVRRRFPKIDDAQLARDLSVAQRTAAKLEPKIDQLVSILQQGEADRPKLTKPRWQAGFDLAIGRALAVKVRTEGYNAMLAAAKQGMTFKNPRSDTWVLRPSREVTVEQRPGQRGGRRNGVSRPRRRRAPGYALGDGRPARTR